MPANPTNNTAATATNLLLSAGLPQTVSGSLSTTADPLDFYKFTTTTATNLKLSLSGLTGNPLVSGSGNARLSVFAADGSTPLNPGIAAGNTSNVSNDGKLSESFVFNALPAGNYVIKVDLGAVGGVASTVADYTLDAIANKDVTANSVLWKQATDPTLVAFQLNGPNLAGDVATVPVGYEIVGTGDFDGVSDAGGKSQDILWKQDLGNGSYALNIWFMNSDNSLRESKPVVLNATDIQAFGVPNAFQIQRLEDFDGDGKTDILFRNTTPGTSSIVLWKMDGATVNTTASQNYTTFDPSYEVFATGDFDNNGIRDIMFRNTTTASGGLVVVWMLDSTLKIIPGLASNPSESGLLKVGNTPILLTSEWTVLGVADFNQSIGGLTTSPLADGRDDILFLNRNTGQLVDWLMNGSQIGGGGYVAGGAPISGTPGLYDLVGLGDLNGDGNSDMLWRPKSKSGVLILWQMEGADIAPVPSGLVALDTAPTGILSLTPTFDIITRTNVAGERSLVDFDGNGRADIYFRETGSGRTIVWSMNGKLIDTAKSGEVKIPDGSVPAVPTTFSAIGGLTAQLASIPQGTAGAALSTAYNMGTLEGLGNYQDTLAGNASDFFKFKLEKTSDVTVALSSAFGSTAALTTASFVLSRDGGVNPNGTPLLVAQPLTAGVPLAAGTYYVEVKKTAGTPALTAVNYNLKVTGEPSTINLKAIALTSVTPTSATFQGTGGAIRLADLTVANPAAKAKVDISYSLTNTEPKATGAVGVKFYLSRVSTINPAGGPTATVALGTDTITQVLGNSAATNRVFQVDLPAGDDNFWTTDTSYYIGYEIDPVSVALPKGTIDETNETDNTLYLPPTSATALDGTKSVLIQNTQTPDLLGAGLTGAASVAKGGTLALNYTVQNAGKKSTGAATPSVRFYIYRPSTDPLLTPEQQNSLVTTDSTRSIALGVTDDNALFLPTIAGLTTAPAKAVSVVLPGVNSSFWTGAAAGTPYFIGMVVDSGETIAESDELNNLNLGVGKDRLAISVA
jgi:FG-GAP-like repeat/Bacterial pre-peptidase C-terminal domain